MVLGFACIYLPITGHTAPKGGGGMNGLMTEREWRKRATRLHGPRPEWWGAQCLLPAKPRESLQQDKAFWAFLMLLSLVTAIFLPLFFPRPDALPVLAELSLQQVQMDTPRRVAAVSYALPEGLVYHQQTYTRQQLLRGKMMLLDDEHPLPKDAPAPNTVSIASEGRGMVPVRGLAIKSGQETIQALVQLFAELRSRGVSGLNICQGTQSPAEQCAAQTRYAYALMQQKDLSQALLTAGQELDGPGSGDYQQEYTVAFCLNGEEGASIWHTVQGEILSRTAWRYGFIRRYPQGEGLRSVQMRYVGRAHATAMTYLNLSLEEYLNWLHQAGSMTISLNGKPKYILMAKEMSGTHVAFSLPSNAVCEASMDNTGYALVACELKDGVF